MSLTEAEKNLRVTALWAFSEAFLGGILHALQVPFAGLILSAFAVICITSLTLNGYKRGQIIKATVLVIIVKALLSPHTPVAAYLAVFLQGFFGELIFFTGIPFFVASLSLGVFALLQSAFQKIIILVILFGTGFWTAVDKFLNSILEQFGFDKTPFTFYIVSVYVLLHLIAGIITGIFAGRLPRTLAQSEKEFSGITYTIPPQTEIEKQTTKTKNKFSNPVFWILFTLLSYAIYQAYTDGDVLSIIQSKAIKLIIRAVLVLVLWYFFLAPLLLLMFKKWMHTQKNKFSVEINAILKLLPEIKFIVQQCWAKTSHHHGLTRINRFLRFTFLALLKTGHAN